MGGARLAASNSQQRPAGASSSLQHQQQQQQQQQHGEETWDLSPGQASHSGTTAAPPGRDDAAGLGTLVRANKLHPSHKLKILGKLVWCDHCGAYSSVRFKALKAVCLGAEKASNRAGQLSQHRQGKHPLTGRPIGSTMDARRPGAASVGTMPLGVQQLQPGQPQRSACSWATPSGQREASSRVAARDPPRDAVRVPLREAAARDRRVEGAQALCLSVSRPTYKALGLALGKLV